LVGITMLGQLTRLAPDHVRLASDPRFSIVADQCARITPRLRYQFALFRLRSGRL
jgi:hypothetical protein